MCGIIGAVAERDVVPILLEGLRRLEYRGYDSAGLAVLTAGGELERERAAGKVERLRARVEARRAAVTGGSGIAHTRWATHGAAQENNAHPHISRDDVAVVHNGIIENHEALRRELRADGYEFTSETDTEVIAHHIHRELERGAELSAAVRCTIARLRGAYALVVLSRRAPRTLVAARMGCPVVIGRGIGENFVASDITALLPVTRRFQFLEDGDMARITREEVRIRDRDGHQVERAVCASELSGAAVGRGGYRHYMAKEIHEQPRAIVATLEERLAGRRVLTPTFGPEAERRFAEVRAVHIVACGTSYHAGLVARYWIERLAGLPVAVEVASEYRYRRAAVVAGTLFVSLSQSGETADTLAALRQAQRLGYLANLAICNVAESSLVRESELVLLTRAGPEIGVASTKAFTTQLVALMLLTLALARSRGLSVADQEAVGAELLELPERIERVLEAEEVIRRLAERFVPRAHALFLARGATYPIALEGALKLKEISYIHAEAYPAGELKHGPLALVDEAMPVVVVAPNDAVLDKLKANMAEVRARGGELIVFADAAAGLAGGEGTEIIPIPVRGRGLLDPVIYTIPLQLLAYHVAVARGTDVDQPRNLAKSVTVE